jgi:hypothetical protein
VTTAGAITLSLSGPTAVYLADDLVLAGRLEVLLTTDEATLDLFISGDVAAAGALDIGTIDGPSRVRIYIGGDGDIAIAGDADLGASLFAPAASVALAGGFTFNGALVVGSLAQAGELRVRYDSDVLDGAGDSCGDGDAGGDEDGTNPGGDCPPGTEGCGGEDVGEDGVGDEVGDDAGDVVGDDDAGDVVDEPGTCATPADCGNQACVDGLCGACSTTLDCAAPLTCADGACIAIAG